VADALGEGFGYFRGDGSVLGDEVGWDAGEVGFELVGVDDGAAEEGLAGASDGGEALGEKASGAGLGGGEGFLAELEVVHDDLFEGLVGGGVEVLVECFFEADGEGVDAFAGFFEGGFGAGELELDLGVAGEDGGFDVAVGGVDGGEERVCG